MEHAQPIPAQQPFPWRATTVVAGGIALVELVALIAIGLMHFAPSSANTTSGMASVRTQHRAAAVAAKPAVKPKPVPQHPLRPRTQVRVLVLNGNGVTGAAAAAAAQLQSHGYRLGGATDADRHDYAQSMVMFLPGWTKEARRLARDTGVRMVTPLDGLRPSQLKGSKLVLLLGK